MSDTESLKENSSKSGFELMSDNEKKHHLLRECDSIMSFFTVEMKRQRRNVVAIYLAMAYLSKTYAENNPELWGSALRAMSVDPKVLTGEESKIILAKGNV